MEELEYSPLLRRLIEKATELDGGPNHKLTAEGFIAAVVCYVRDVSDPDSQQTSFCMLPVKPHPSQGALTKAILKGVLKRRAALRRARVRERCMRTSC